MSSLRRAAATGVRWTALSTAAAVTAQFVQFTVLARLLVPEEFGLMAMALVLVGFARSFADFGVSGAVIQRRELSEEARSSLYWLGLALGLAFFLATLALAPHVAAFYREPRVVAPLAWLAVSFLIVPLGQQFQLLLERDLRFRAVGLIEALSAVVGSATAIAVALAEPSVWALVVGHLASVLTRTALLLPLGWSAWRPRLRFRRDDLRGYLSFGLYQMGERGVNFFNQRLDQLLIGALAGARNLGYYNFAYFLATQVNQRVNPILTRVAFPVLAQVQHDPAKLRKGYMTVRRFLATFNIPALLGLAAVAPRLVPLVFGETWAPAIELVQILVGVAVLRSLGNPIGSALLARGRADLGFRWNLGLLLVHVPGLALGAWLGGTRGIAVALLLLHLGYASIEYPCLVRPLLGPCLREYASGVLPALGSAGGMLAVVVALGHVLGPTGPTAVLLAQVAAGVAIYASLLWAFDRGATRELLCGLAR